MSNFLKNKKCYLSGPIEHGSGTNWRIEPKRILKERFGINLFDPFADPKQQWVPALNKARDEKNYEEMRRIAKSFVRKDLSEVDKSDFVIGYLPFKVPTTGTHHEIINSNDRKKPTLLICPTGKQNIPLWYYGFIPHQTMFSSFDELYEYLQEVNDGKHLSNDRWSCVYDLV